MDEKNTGNGQKPTRNALGQYEKGHAGGPGRPPGSGNPRRATYTQAAYESVSIQEWKAIIAKAKRDALGVKIVASEGRSVVVDDPESSGINRNAARIFIRDTIVGRPAQYIHVDSEDDALTEFDSYTDAELRAIANAPDAFGGLSDDDLVAVARGLDDGSITNRDTAITTGDNAAGASGADAGNSAADIGGTGGGA